MKLFPMLLFLLGLPAAVSAQASADTVAAASHQARRVGIASFAQQNLIWGKFRLDPKQTLRYSLFSDALYNSSLPENRFVKEDYLFQLQHEYNLLDNLTWSQHAAYIRNKATLTTIGSFLERLTYRHRFDTLITTQYTAFAGIRHDRRNLYADTGPEVGGEFNAELNLPGTDFATARILASRAWAGNRQFRRILAESYYENRFDVNSSASVRLGYRSNITEDYVSGNIQQVRSDTLGMDVNLFYQFSKQTVFKSQNRFALPQRGFLYRPHETGAAARQSFRFNQFELETMQEISHTREKLRTSLQFVYKERNRRYTLENNLNLAGSALQRATEQERIKDVLEQTTGWQFNADYRLTAKHMLTAQTYAQLLRLNTPSNENNQDRDEVYYIGKAQLTSYWTSTFRTTFALAADYKQFVFIKAEQSVENYTDRILRYEPGFTWAPGRFSWKAQFNIWATYHVRALPSESLKNRSNRTFSQQHELGYRLTEQLQAGFVYARRENRTGLLNWAKFTESPLDTTISNDFSVFLQKRFKNEKLPLSLKTGFRFFEQQVNSRAGLASNNTTSLPQQIFLQRYTRQFGPELTLEILNQKGFSLLASCWFQWLQTFNRYQVSDDPYVGQAFAPEELNLRSNNFYPYFDISLNWLLLRNR